MSLVFMIWHLNCYSFTKSRCIAYILKTLKLCVLFGPETFIQKNYEHVQNFSYIGVYHIIVYYIWKHGKYLTIQDWKVITDVYTGYYIAMKKIDYVEQGDSKTE